ncbi:HpcH/HpaI aldolase/citrate lyase family protein [Bordetella genomosp. 9]|uniref:CoA ester lyase n=1 Tax=Bordetella genomosp. 9 TaxID=1416803 RepID=A0A1W6YZ93_9BORD|nr:CoA ester lyase [Bordetella genomosp. 9]ARP86199.1 CoA ester lyase [Bordetella genomosp. 9]
MKSKLFVPASRPELFPKAMRSAADAISFDLEDAVAPERKDEARTILAKWLQAEMAHDFPGHGKKIIVRVNGADTPLFHADLQALAAAPVDILNVPKLESAADVQAVAKTLLEAGFRGGLLVNIETPAALANAAAIASAHEMVCGLQLGLGDLFEPLGIARYVPETLRHVMLALRLAAGASGKYVLDGAYPNVADQDGFRAEARLSRSLGFLGKSCIHPTQIAIANEVYAYSSEEIAQARRIVQASRAQAGTGAFLLDGKMIDAPFVRRAKDILLASGQA